MEAGTRSIEKYRTATLCSIAVQGFRARVLERRSGSALKHGFLVLIDWLRFGSSSLQGTFRGKHSILYFYIVLYFPNYA